jgi:hypothetical protein
MSIAVSIEVIQISPQVRSTGEVFFVIANTIVLGMFKVSRWILCGSSRVAAFVALQREVMPQSMTLLRQRSSALIAA